QVATPEAQAVGRLAETKALEYERDRLTAAGYPELALLVQHISLIDQYAGYDILSYRGTKRRPENSIYIEVKGTKNQNACFVWTRNERLVADRQRQAYWLYVYTSVDLNTASATGPIRIYDPSSRLDKLGYVQEAIDVYVTRV